MVRLAAVVVVALALQGCGDFVQAPTPAPPQPQPYQRFVPVATSDRDFALDTKTGKLCKTWTWTIADSPLSSLPECIALYSEYPDRAAPSSTSTANPSR